MQEVCEIICRYALETGKLPTMTEVARRIGLSKERTRQLWIRVERYERSHHLAESVHIKRAQMGYLLAVLKDIEAAAKMAGRRYPWKNRWQGPRPPPVPRPNPKRPKPKPRPWLLGGWGRAPERQRATQPPTPYRPQFGDLVECKTCHGTAVQDGDWCSVCNGEGTVVHEES